MEWYVRAFTVIHNYILLFSLLFIEFLCEIRLNEFFSKQLEELQPIILVPEKDRDREEVDNDNNKMLTTIRIIDQRYKLLKSFKSEFG